jgi:hydrophobic/amphiphilic exporter-1 (mainly G- bacteria), HAE1 family
MNIKTFIDRPILSVMLSIVIVIIGIIGLQSLPLEQYPDIAPPTVKVNATYVGANAETVMKSVVTPLEASINGVENMQYMTSTAANNGTCTITIYFKQGSDPNMAVVNVQNRVASAQGLLPAEVTKSGVTVRKTQNSNLKFITLYSPNGRYDSKTLTNYMKINIEPQLSRIPGVGEVNVFGADYALRIWLNPAKMHAYGLVPADIDNALAAQNIESPMGALAAESDNTFQYVLKYRGRYSDASEFRNIVIKASGDGGVLRLGDVARVELGTADYNMKSTTNGKPGASASITQTAGTNANDIIKQIDKVEDDVRQSLPDGMVLEDQTSVMDFLNASMRNVTETLVIALVLVVIVVFVFLRDWRSMVIPTIAILVSLIGTFAFMYVAGFSLNLLTLFALVLVIGTVVDDSIVVAEAVQTKLSQGCGSVFRATVEAMQDLKSALITTTIVFMAVFIPVSFTSGTAGVFYKEFGLTMAAAVAISLFNALTLCPALSALVLKRKTMPVEGKQNKWQEAYMRTILKLVKHRKLIMLSLPLSIALLAIMIATTKTSLVPQEDMGTIDVNVQCRPGYSLAQTGKVMDQVEAVVKNIPQIKIHTRIDGRDAQQNQTSSAGFLSVRLKNWSERTGRADDIDSVVNEIYRRTAFIKEANVNCATLPTIRGYGSASGFELYVQNRSGEDFKALSIVIQKITDALNKRPEIGKAHYTFNMDYPQYLVEVDAARCMMKNVSPGEVLATMSAYIGGDYASNINKYTKLYRVMVQSEAAGRLNERALDNMFVRSADETMSPLSEFVTLKKVNGAEYLTHFNLFPAIRINGTAADGYSSGQAIRAISEVAAQTLPNGYGYELGGLSREESSQGNATIVILALSIVFIYIILCCLYESLLLPFAIILVVPFGLCGSFLLAQAFGIDNSIYMQIGLVMLIGMLAKTGILLTEYATERRKAGESIISATLSAATVRLRPIIMTASVMIIGMLPLMLAHGAGARGNVAIGTCVVGGMVAGTIAILLLLPVLYCIFETWDEKIRQRK